MRKLLISVAVFATLSGCSWFGGKDDDGKQNRFLQGLIPTSLDRLPFIYHPKVQQGNIIEQERIDQLKPGMVKRQVQYVMGTPMLIDVFHQDRWDYVYTKGSSLGIEEQKQVSLYFEKGRLARIVGDLKPEKEKQDAEPKESVVSVPDWENPHKSILEKAVDAVGLGEK